MDGIWFRLRLPAPPCSALPPQTGDNPMVDLYFWPTGNGKKTVILLGELGLPYTIKPINIGRGDQLTPDFLKISPNGRMPPIVAGAAIGSGGSPLRPPGAVSAHSSITSSPKNAQTTSSTRVMLQPNRIVR